MTVKFHWSRPIIIITVIYCFVGLIVIPLILYWCGITSLFVFYGCLLGIMLANVSQMPCSLSVNSESIIFKKPFSSVKIALQNIETIEQLPPGNMRSTRFLIGHCGLFGYWGSIDVKNKGKFYMHATQQENLIMIKTNFYRSYIFSCSQSKEFIKKCQDYGIENIYLYPDSYPIQ